MTITVDQFRLDFPEFADMSKSPDATIQFNLNTAYLLLTERWDSTIIDLGAELFCAHMTALSMQNQRVAAIGGIPGQASGIISSKSVNGVSVSYQMNDAMMPGWNDFNLTTYGRRFAFFANIVGMGGHQSGIGFPSTLGFNEGVFAGGNLLGQD